MAPRAASGGGDAAPSVKMATKRKVMRIGKVDDAPQYMKLPLLFEGYRLNYDHWAAFKSMFTIHLDTVNIWTHFLGFLYFLYQLKETFTELRKDKAGYVDYLLFTVFHLGAMYQMLASTIYHIFRCVDFDTDALLLRLDLGGIAAMIIGSYVVGMTQGFVCSPGYTVLYIGLLCAILAVAGIMASWPDFQKPEYDHVRNMVFGSAVGYSVIPVVHWLSHCSSAVAGGEQCSEIVMSAYFAMMAFYGTGYIIFMTRFPECLFPNTFDYFGASHQIWHVFVWAAGAAWLRGMLSYRHWRMEHHGHCTDGHWWSTHPWEAFD